MPEFLDDPLRSYPLGIQPKLNLRIIRNEHFHDLRWSANGLREILILPTSKYAWVRRSQF